MSDSGYYGGESLNVYNEDGEIVDVEDDCKGAVATPLYISPDDSNSTASPVLVREFAAQGPVRVWEFLNYYTFDYAPAPAGSVTVDLQLRPTDDPSSTTSRSGSRAKRCRRRSARP
jgi:hypothetical protein